MNVECYQCGRILERKKTFTVKEIGITKRLCERCFYMMPKEEQID